MLYRKLMTELISWKNNEDLNIALLIEGAHQVGKTRLIEEFCKDFRESITIDFTKNATALELLLEIKNYEDFVNRLSIISKKRLDGVQDILFLDEIQYYYEVRQKRIESDPSFKEKYIDIITLSKEIATRKDFRLILSGSMLGVSAFNINHNPTGYLRVLKMYPMDFEEFLLACGIHQSLIDDARQSFLDRTPVSDSLNDLLLRKFNEYLFVGGYPAAVQGYVNDKTLSLTESSLDTIDNWYREDIIKYAPKEDRLIILEMYRLLASEITMKNKKFVKSHLDVPNFKNLNLQDRYLWLRNAGIAIPTYNVTNPVYPLAISMDSKIIKLFVSDVGLLTHKLFDSEAKRKLMVNRDGVDLGAVYENAVAELLECHGYPPYFYSNKKRGEVDFIIEKNMNIIPIEIKSYAPSRNNGLFSHPALDNLLDGHKEIKEAWVFGLNNIKKESNTITMFPIYMIDFVRKS